MERDLIKAPAPSFQDFGRSMARGYRATVRDSNNMFLGQIRPVNDITQEERWRGNGFQGTVQFIPTFVGRGVLRPYAYDKDRQISTMPKDNSRPLNERDRGHNGCGAEEPPAEERRAHDEATRTIRRSRSLATVEEFS